MVTATARELGQQRQPQKPHKRQPSTMIMTQHELSLLKDHIRYDWTKQRSSGGKLGGFLQFVLALGALFSGVFNDRSSGGLFSYFALRALLLLSAGRKSAASSLHVMMIQEVHTTKRDYYQRFF